MLDSIDIIPGAMATGVADILFDGILDITGALIKQKNFAAPIINLDYSRVEIGTIIAKLFSVLIFRSNNKCGNLN